MGLPNWTRWAIGLSAAAAVGAVSAALIAWPAAIGLGLLFCLFWIVATFADQSLHIKTDFTLMAPLPAPTGPPGELEGILRSRVALLEAQINAAPDGMLVVDENARRTLTNSRMLEMFNIPDKVFRDPDDGALRDHVVNLTRNPRQFRARIMELYEHRNEKAREEVELTTGAVLDRYTAPVFGRNGEYYGRIWVFRDITQQKRSEEDKHKLAQVVEQTPTSVLITDLNGNIEYVNKAFAETFGYTAAEVRGKNARTLKSGMIPEQMYTQLWAELKAGREWHGELENRCKNGQTIWQLVNVSPLRNAHGEPTHYIAISENITARKAMEDELRVAALSDKLTGLPNRGVFGDRLQKAIEKARGNPKYYFAVLYLDFDRFKTINDSLGHEFGDMLLKEVAQRLRATMRAGDSLCRADEGGLAARLGGDEFVVLLENLHDDSEAALVAGRLIKVFSKPYKLGENEVCLTVSIGVVTSRNSAANPETILRDADTAMYEAKQNGRGRYEVFDSSMYERVETRLRLENGLRSAIGTDQLFLLYQPIVSLSTGKVNGYEALIRWRHPEDGVLLPEKFIHIAEDAGLILALGKWVLEEACAQFARWRKIMGSSAPSNVRVNLSRQQLILSDFPETLKNLLAVNGMEPQCLHLEVTESAVMKDVSAAVRMLRAISDLGVVLDVDDFGTGYSSLACLRQFPINGLKVDRSFVAALNGGRDLVALVQAVTQLALNLKLTVTAEGIETIEQALILQCLDCDFGQGFLFSRPITAEEVVHFKVRPNILPGQAGGEESALNAA